jgi:hypothetical protein
LKLVPACGRPSGAPERQRWLFLLFSAANITQRLLAAARTLEYRQCRRSENSGNAGCSLAVFRCSSLDLSPLLDLQVAPLPERKDYPI